MTLHPPPRVLIAGAGLGSLFLAVLFERAGIPYHIYERAAVAKPLGATLSISAHILPVFEQLGLLDDLKKIAFPYQHIELYRENQSLMGTVNASTLATTGYDPHMLHRPDLYNLLLSRVPAEKISLNKKVVDIEQNEQGVIIRTSDGETYNGDILVGADGAYSAVRDKLFKQLDKEDKLPATDKTGLTAANICIAGTTRSLDPERFPIVKHDHTRFMNFIGRDKVHSWMVFTLPNNRMAYIIQEHLGEESPKDIAALRKERLSQEAKEKFIKDVYNFPIKASDNEESRQGKRATLGDLIDATEPGIAATVLLEEKMFETWHHGRTVLIGDAVHKMHPASGQGCVNAMQDAVVLANCLYEISEGKEPVTSATITRAFSDYREQRYGHAKAQVEIAHFLSRFLGGMTWRERLLRWIILHVPKIMMARRRPREGGYRPQVAFLPRIPDPPTLEVTPQTPSRRYTRETHPHQ
ncbi:hypothetical protein B0O80DRAFT_459841 [Mortierella sp. GBAus27b]|nr:hypothetical protein BGX31_002883 [Mortierella sp. GBA43]KAI8349580.1 hypothetical protein B0O80DRAFT_459841 [Mortierella sp. GBAus27b]